MRKLIKYALIILMPGFFTYANLAYGEAQSGLSGTVKVLAGNWTGENGNSGTDFEASDGAQWSISLGYQYEKFYTGFNLQGGVYAFKTVGPDQMSATTSQPLSNVEVAHSELDIVAGMYITPRFSLFLDLKGISNTWQGYTYEQAFGGLGIGATGIWPVNTDWMLYGTVGFLSNGVVTVNNVEVGSGKNTTLDFGAMYSLGEGQRLILGLKVSNHTYDFDSGDQQTQQFSGIFLGYNHSFFFN